jgi:hypothetical protein
VVVEKNVGISERICTTTIHLRIVVMPQVEPHQPVQVGSATGDVGRKVRLENISFGRWCTLGKFRKLPVQGELSGGFFRVAYCA